MSAFAEFFRERGTIIDRYFKYVEEAQNNREVEFAAAMRIKRAWKNYLTRKRIAHENAMANKIQNVFRMHQAKMLVRCLRVEKARAERIAYFNAMAMKIQRVWRGFDSRRHIFDFYKQRQYLAQVAAANENMRRELDDHFAMASETARRVKFAREARRREENALHQHHLVSTSAIPSIFQPPSFTKDADAMPAVENFIRNVNRARLVIPSLGSR